MTDLIITQKQTFFVKGSKIVKDKILKNSK